MLSESPLVASTPSTCVRTVLITDLAASVSIMRENPQDTVLRWHRLLEHIRDTVLSSCCGRLVESRGDSVILIFIKPNDALRAAFAIKRFCEVLNEGLPSQRHFLLRSAIHVGEVYVGENEVLGDTVNLAARLQQTIAGPGEIVVSADVHDYLTPVLDADIEDLGIKDIERETLNTSQLGAVYLKHYEAPVRVYRVGPPGPRPVIDRDIARSMRPTIAVIPFMNRRLAAAGGRVNDATDDDSILGEILADDIISALSPATVLNVVSRLSTTVFNGRNTSLEDIGAHLKADYVLSGRFYVLGKHIFLDLELANVASGQIQWNPPPIKAETESVISRTDGICGHIAGEVVGCVMQRELERGQQQALPTLENYTLLINAIVRMHRGSPEHFERARQMLQALTERIPRVALPYAWLAKWHVLQFNRGLSPNTDRESRIALDCTKRAIDCDPSCSLAHTMSGFVNTNMLKKLDVAQADYTRALAVNPNDSLAWLLKGTMHAFQGKGDTAVEHTERALQLSPLDPLRYYYESLAATAAHCAGKYERAIALAESSLKANQMHSSTLRSLVVAQVQLGRMDDARKTMIKMRSLEPNLTVRSYLMRHPSSYYETGKIWAEALRKAGLPD